MALPTFLGMGAQRSGTTTLHNLLQQHPDICMPLGVKEPHFFDRDFDRGLFHYERTYFGGHKGEPAIGEITPTYMYLPEVAERIAATLGRDLKLVFSLRNPASRAYSQYRMNFSFFWETESFETALALEPERLRDPCNLVPYGYLNRGYYARQVRALLKLFPRERMHFLIFEEDLRGDQQVAADALFGFLGVRSVKVNPVNSNASTMPTVTVFDREVTLQINRDGQTEKTEVPAGGVMVQAFFGPQLSVTRHPSRQFLDVIATHQRQLPLPPSLPDALKRQLTDERFRDDIAELEELIGRDLSVWRPA